MPCFVHDCEVDSNNLHSRRLNWLFKLLQFLAVPSCSIAHKPAVLHNLAMLTKIDSVSVCPIRWSIVLSVRSGGLMNNKQGFSLYRPFCNTYCKVVDWKFTPDTWACILSNLLSSNLSLMQFGNSSPPSLRRRLFAVAFATYERIRHIVRCRRTSCRCLMYCPS